MTRRQSKIYIFFSFSYSNLIVIYTFTPIDGGCKIRRVETQIESIGGCCNGGMTNLAQNFDFENKALKKFLEKLSRQRDMEATGPFYDILMSCSKLPMC